MLETGRDLVIRFQWPALITFCLAAAGLAWIFAALRAQFLPVTRFRLLAPLVSLLGAIAAAAMAISLFIAFTEPVWRYECFSVWRLPLPRTCHLLFFAAVLLSALA